LAGSKTSIGIVVGLLEEWVVGVEGGWVVRERARIEVLPQRTVGRENGWIAGGGRH